MRKIEVWPRTLQTREGEVSSMTVRQYEAMCMSHALGSNEMLVDTRRDHEVAVAILCMCEPTDVIG